MPLCSLVHLFTILIENSHSNTLLRAHLTLLMIEDQIEVAEVSKPIKPFPNKILKVKIKSLSLHTANIINFAFLIKHSQLTSTFQSEN